MPSFVKFDLVAPLQIVAILLALLVVRLYRRTVQLMQPNEPGRSLKESFLLRGRNN